MIFLWIMEGVESLFMSVFEGRNWSPFAGSPGISWLAIARRGFHLHIFGMVKES